MNIIDMSIYPIYNADTGCNYEDDKVELEENVFNQVSGVYQKLLDKSTGQTDKALLKVEELTSMLEQSTDRLNKAIDVLGEKYTQIEVINHFLAKLDLHEQFIGFLQHTSNIETKRADIKKATKDLLEEHKHCIMDEYGWTMGE